MKCYLNLFFLLLTLLIPGMDISAQDKCATVQYEEYRRKLDPVLENKEAFENWLKIQRQKIFNSNNLRTQQVVIQIPIVVHVVHNGEPIGTGTNISDTQINSQIDVLNEDFRRLNKDTTDTPLEFKPVAADIEIEFVLAKQDPEGLPTSGIVRVQGEKASWSYSSDNSLLKSQSYWPAEDYLNLWVAPLDGIVLGYAQFPVSSLAGLAESSNNRLTDGVVIDPDVFGSVEKDPTAKLDSRYNLGRTTTHEIGHFLGLRHIWGDGGCEVDDFCTDTPVSSGSTSGCPGTKESCGSSDMFQNYMDFTDDRCMNIFTGCQKDRMRIVMNESPRRNSLPTSHALNTPAVLDNDSGIKRIISPQEGLCQLNFIPEVVVRNYGNNIVSSSEITLSINGLVDQTITPALNLDPLDSVSVSFSEVILPQSGVYNFEIRVTKTNGITEADNFNNTQTIEVVVPQSVTIPESQNFDTFPPSWLKKNPDGLTGWTIINAPHFDPNNSAIYMNFYDYEDGIGEQDMLISPKIDLSTANTPNLLFDLAYATFSGFQDALTIAVSTDCGNNFDQIIYNKSGTNLATAGETATSFIPSSNVDWKREVISLSNFIGETELMIAFIAQNGYGNNLYLDNITITDQVIYDLGVTQIVTPGLISCNQVPDLSIELENSGNLIIDSFRLALSIEGIQVLNEVVDFQILPGSRKTLNLQPFEFGLGGFDLSVQISEPNGNPDLYEPNNSISKTILIDNQFDIIPARENFELGGLTQTYWTPINQDNDIGWSIIPAAGEIPDNLAVYINTFNYANIGSKDLLVSPTINLANQPEASLFFNVAYADNDLGTDGLKVLLSKDCGNTFPITLYAKSGTELSTTFQNSEFIPDSPEDWRLEFIDLSNYVGNEEIRIAFEVTNGYGNNLFIDDIELFVSNDPNPVTISGNVLLYPNPSENAKFSLTFNLEERSEVAVTIYNTLGREITTDNFANTLNQTYAFDITGNPTGMYLVKIAYPDGNYEILRAFIRNG